LGAGSTYISENYISYLTNYAGAGSVSNHSAINGIYSADGNTTVIKNTIINFANSGGNFAEAGSSVIGISIIEPQFLSASVINNRINNLRNMNTAGKANVLGILFYATTQGKIEKNFIHSLSSASTDTSSVIAGIQITSTSTTCQNNIVSLHDSTAIDLL
jgi:hypothetical protein